MERQGEEVSTTGAMATSAVSDRILSDAARLARSIAGTTMAAVTLADDTHTWFVAKAGLDAERVKRTGTFCNRTMPMGERFVVEDALNVPDFAPCDFVTDGPRMRFYAGLPLRSREGFGLGTLCVADQRPRRDLDEEQFRHLTLLLEITIGRLEQHRVARKRNLACRRARELNDAFGSEAASLTQEAERLVEVARAHELATDAAMQGVRQIVLLDREIHDGIMGVPDRRGAAFRPNRLPPALRSQFDLHNAVSLATEEEIDLLVGTAASLRLRSATLRAQGRRLIELSSVLEDAVMDGVEPDDR